MADRPTCPRKETLGAYVDRRLSSSETDALEAHLADCAGCRREAADLALLVREVAGSALAASARWMERARARIRPQPATARALAAGRRSARPWVAAAAVALAAVILVLVTRAGESPPLPVVRRSEEPKRPAPPKPPAEKPAAGPQEPRPPQPLPEPKPPPPVRPPVPVEKPPEPPKKPEEKSVAKEEPGKNPETAKPNETVADRKPVHLRSALLAAAGAASTRLAGEPAWKTLKVGQTVDFKGVLQVKTADARTKARLGADTLYFSRNTELAISPQEDATRLRLGQGEAFFSVDAEARKGVYFVVETPHGTVTVRGTRFLISVEAKETAVHVERGKVDVAAAGKTVTLADGELSAVGEGREPRAPERAPIAAKIKWVQDLEEVLRIEAELLALKAPFRVVREAGASGGSAIAVPANANDNIEGTAETRVRRKQPVPYTIWVRILFTRGNDARLSLQLGDLAPVPVKAPAAPQWQWIRLGAFDPPDGDFRVRLSDRLGGARTDQIVLTSDPDFSPESK